MTAIAQLEENRTVEGVYADLTRFTHEEIHQNVARSDASLSVRAILGLRTGTAATNVLDEKSLRATVRDCS